MPIDYKRYPANWLSEIRPRIMARANNTCEMLGATSGTGKRFGQLNTMVKVVLTIAHLDHDEHNMNVSDDRLMAMCQLCHLRYDAKEKYRRALKPKSNG